MAAALLQLAPSSQESAAARAALVDDLVDRETRRGYERRNRSRSWPPPSDRRDDLTAWQAGSVARQLARLDPTPDERVRARAALLALLPPLGDKTASDPRDRWSQRGDSVAANARSTVDGLIALEPTTEEKQRARAAILELLAGEDESQFIGGLVAALALLTPQPQETTTALRYLVDHPGWQEDPNVLWSPPSILVRGLVDLGCTIESLLETTAWVGAADEVPMLLTAARQNSPLEEWLRSLPQLARLSP